MQATGHAANSPRTDARKSKLRSLTPEQKAALLRFLFEEKLTYKAAIARMFAEFSVKLSMEQMSFFWNAHARPAATDAGDVLFEVIIQPSGPVRIVAKQNPLKLEISPL
jgi:hypothetical protein